MRCRVALRCRGRRPACRARRASRGCRRRAPARAGGWRTGPRASSGCGRPCFSDSATNFSCSVTAAAGVVAGALHVVHAVEVGSRVPASRPYFVLTSCGADAGALRPAGCRPLAPTSLIADADLRGHHAHLQQRAALLRLGAVARGARARSRGPSTAASSASFSSSVSSPRLTAILPPGSAQAFGTELFSTDELVGQLPVGHGGELLARPRSRRR